MAGYTDLPFRLLVRRLGCELAWTEMVSAEGVARNNSQTGELLRTVSEDHPLVVQLFGSNPMSLSCAAVSVVEAGADALDINMGCSVKKVVKTGAGAALLQNLKKAEAVIRAVRKAVTVPLMIKIRLGWKEGDDVYRTLGRMAEAEGVDAVVFHPRYALQGFRGRADWSAVMDLKQRLRIPVIGSGDILDPTQALTRKAQTGCDGIMIGRQALRTPWIFQQIRMIQEGLENFTPDLDTRRRWLSDHWAWVVDHYDGPTRITALRRILFVLTRGLPGSGEFRQKAAVARSRESLRALFEEYFASRAVMG